MSDRIYILDKKLFASERKRFVGGIVDFIFVFVSVFISGLIIVIIGNIFNWNIFSIWGQFINDSTYLALFTFLMLNYLFLECFFGATMGKFATGIIVVTENGTKPNFGRIFIRTLCRLIPFDVFSFLGKSGMFWHDSFSRTYVVDKRGLERDLEIFYSIDLIGQNEVV
ncbi:RDD family protein [Flavobacterium ginsenosidimutans]|uniref:RDD family protein n=1 Tax=Flavobacterium ginsenosidimutans TaxID=687844 RepID=UPI000DAE94B1|nr:RDD family protein [Flavobacterium ginsenosidimutans]KAF2329648.1 RDD family protein [Flavobacterium ginsenosidimutans]